MGLFSSTPAAPWFDDPPLAEALRHVAGVKDTPAALEVALRHQMTVRNDVHRRELGVHWWGLALARRDGVEPAMMSRTHPDDASNADAMAVVAHTQMVQAWQLGHTRLTDMREEPRQRRMELMARAEQWAATAVGLDAGCGAGAALLQAAYGLSHNEDELLGRFHAATAADATLRNPHSEVNQYYRAAWFGNFEKQLAFAWQQLDRLPAACPAAGILAEAILWAMSDSPSADVITRSRHMLPRLQQVSDAMLTLAPQPHPQWPETHQTMALALLELGDRPRAAAHASRGGEEATPVVQIWRGGSGSPTSSWRRLRRKLR